MEPKEERKSRKPNLEFEAIVEDRSAEATDLDLAVQRQIIEFLLELHRQKKGQG